MRITLDYRHPSPSHCYIGVFVNGACAGELCLRQEEILTFQMVISHGLSLPDDVFKSSGNPDPPGGLITRKTEER